MAAKRKITIKKKAKKVEPVVEEVKIEEVKPEEEEKVEETPVTIVEEEIKIDAEEPKEIKSQIRGEIVGMGTKTVVQQPKGRIKFEAQQSSFPMFKLPPDIRQYLLNKGFGTNVWKRDKEWLEKHGADMKMIEKLKQFLSGNL